MSDPNHASGFLADFGGIAGGVAAVATAAIAVLQYFKFTTYRDKVLATRSAFEAVVASLASTNEVDRLAGAILLRRFFDPSSEVTTTGTPYATEAVNVIAAILRGQQTGNFQKLLADGLAFAPSLRKADLQRTNLNNAYLGSRGKGRVDLSQADFYRADLTGASLKGANASGAIFYQSRMTDVVLRNADLSGANFFEAELLGANFSGAKLNGANFERARNLPADFAPYIKDNKWAGPDPYTPSPDLAKTTAKVVYVSKPGCLDAHQEKTVALVCRWAESAGLTTSMFERIDYPPTGVFPELRRRISGCAGVIVFGFADLRVFDGLWRPGTIDEAKIGEQASSTPWSHIEAGMAAMMNMPMLLVVEPDVNKGVFDPSLVEHNIFRLPVPPDPLSPAFRSWLVAVGERTKSA